ncbi:hypothetical protein D1007_50983 [Hordeum vulgare]|nr:hypothetical protein D1007_50983 [Hordeum vulgare]
MILRLRCPNWDREEAGGALPHARVEEEASRSGSRGRRAPAKLLVREDAPSWRRDDDSEVDSCGDSDDEVEELVVLSDDVPYVQLLAPVLDAVEGHKNLPIDVEKLPEVADLPEVVVVKQEVLEEDVVAPTLAKKKSAAGKKTAVRRSERVKMLKKEE